MAEETRVPRVPPHSEEAEQSVLGSMMMDHDAVNAAVESLTPEDFYNVRHSEIFRAMVDLNREGRDIRRSPRRIQQSILRNARHVR